MKENRPGYIEEEKYIKDLKAKITELKKKKNAVILAHNYQRDEVQDAADIIGDSLELSKAAANTTADIIVFCGVNFMAEIASVLNPDKKVLLPVKEAGCPAADMISPERLRAEKNRYPDAAVVCYVNSSVLIKAESDICCTSRNAVKIVSSLKNKQVIFIPDENLGKYVQSKVPDKELILWKGFCPTHIRVSRDEIIDVKSKHPKAEFIAHPECELDILAEASFIGGTGEMLNYVKSSVSKEFIIGTEKGLIYRLAKENPAKKFYPASEHIICADMKLTTLGWVVHSLEMSVYEVRVEDSIRSKAKRALDRMLEIS